MEGERGADRRGRIVRIARRKAEKSYAILEALKETQSTPKEKRGKSGGAGRIPAPLNMTTVQRGTSVCNGKEKDGRSEYVKRTAPS